MEANEFQQFEEVLKSIQSTFGQLANSIADFVELMIAEAERQGIDIRDRLGASS